LDDDLTAMAVAAVEMTEVEVLDDLAPWGDGEIAAAVATLSLEQLAIAEWRYVDGMELSTIASGTRTPGSARRPRPPASPRPAAHDDPPAGRARARGVTADLRHDEGPGDRAFVAG